MLSSRASAARLAHRLYNHLATKISHRELRLLHWFDFQDHDHPVTDDSAVMAAHAFRYLFIPNGIWNEHREGLLGVLAFMKAETGLIPIAQDMNDLATILRTPPVNELALEDWFYNLYPPITPNSR